MSARADQDQDRLAGPENRHDPRWTRTPSKCSLHASSAPSASFLNPSSILQQNTVTVSTISCEIWSFPSDIHHHLFNYVFGYTPSLSHEFFGYTPSLIKPSRTTQVIGSPHLWKIQKPHRGEDPHTPLQRSSALRFSTNPNPPTPQETRPSASERKSGCIHGAASTIAGFRYPGGGCYDFP